MVERTIPTRVLLTETLRLLLRFLLFVALAAVVCFILYPLLGIPKPWVYVVALFVAVLYFSAPLASSDVRFKRGQRLFTRAGGKTLLFSFVWGAAVAGLFVAALHFWQGMGATLINYVLTMGAAGIVCAAAATIPGSR
jgi:hypothetical protein